MVLIELWYQYRVYVLVAAVLVLVYLGRSSTTRQDNDIPALSTEKQAPPQEKQQAVPLKTAKSKSYPTPVDFTSVSTKKAPKKFSSGPKKFSAKRQAPNGASLDSRIIVLYSTLTGTSQRYAEKVHKYMCSISSNKSNPPELTNLDYVDDLDKYFVSLDKDLHSAVLLLILPSYETESPLDYLIELLKETYNDFRIDSKPLAKLAGFSVFGLGDLEGWPEEEGRYCYQAKLVDKYLGKLGARRIFPLGTACNKSDPNQKSLDQWLGHLESTLSDPASIAEEVDIADSDDEEDADNEDSGVVDVEDMGKIIKQSTTSPVDITTKEMVAKDSPTFNALTKQGYTVVGSHSGVKICRWTKSALRGRGSCYKFSFYGIRSHLCMETTPSLSCSNKCVFCWRHGTNPVGTTWRWQVDPPDAIFNGALEGHYKKIKQMRGVPGVLADRFAEAFQVRHCALSLVGEPIFYPHINEFVDLLHGQRISSFLVCNAQHPAQLEALKRVTQLYVSIDAPTKESLRKVDRPLHRDFWERLEQCLDILRTKQSQRTVFRLTLVKDFNTDDLHGYADMVERARPAFIEIKGVTYCGTSKSNPLTMQNVPFYEEVKTFVEKLNETLNARGLEYGIAAEHAHSCCILIAQKRFNIDGVWHTAINYDRFFDLLEAGADFGPMDYIAPTPEWAHYGNGGFNPEDTRFIRKKAAKKE